MNYSDLVALIPSSPGAELSKGAGSALGAPGIEGLPETYGIVEAVSKEPAYVFFPPYLQPAESREGCGLLVMGSSRATEADVMLAVSLVAQDVELGSRKWEVAQVVGPLGGKFRVIPFGVPKADPHAQDFIRCRLRAALAEWGIQVTSACGTPSVATCMEAFHTAFPGHGLLLLVEPEGIEDAGPSSPSLPGPVLHQVAVKSPAQRALVREYLQFFTPYYGDMEARIEEFVSAFPLHPDYVDVIGRIKLPGRRPAWQTAVEAVGRVLREPLPLERPGVIAYDSYWEELLKHSEFAGLPEVEAVVESARRAEAEIARSIIEPERRQLAVRVIHALCIHRLTTADIYCHEGITIEALRDRLCLFQEGLMAGPAEASALLLARIRNVLEELQSRLGSDLLAFDKRRGEYYLQFNRFRRFVKPELVLHWVNAVPFLLLLATGGAMLGARFFPVALPFFRGIVAVHKFFACCWVLLLPLTVLIRMKVHWRHLREMLRWGKEDLVWMVQTLRSLQNKAAPVSPAGRFNTGQKINACLVMFYFIGFGCTGLLMWFKGSILVPWYVHTVLFFAALGSVGGHLFLALVNPSTRISLAGIFHGWAPMEYVEHHHALSLPFSLRRHLWWNRGCSLFEELVGSRKEMILIGVLAVLVGVDVMAFNNWKLESIKRRFAKSFADCIQPGELSTKHRLGSSADSCTKCHSFTGEIPDANCESCHGYIKQRRDNLVGYHGRLQGECVHCHKEHPARLKNVLPLLPQPFDHTLAAFKRDGKHAQVTCDECHKKKRSPDKNGVYYLGLKHESCTDCHRDPHAKQFTAACETCHSPAGWTGRNLMFSHAADSRFKLLGKHQTVECAKCHRPKSAKAALASAVFKGTSDTCADCHKEPHRQQFKADCTACHSTGGWRGEHLLFDHAKDSRFPLVGKHAQTDCAKCHTPGRPGEPLGYARFTGLKSECADCHKDPHRGQFDKSCTACHPTPVTWKVTAPDFEHNRDTKWPLVGKHIAVDCLRCHKPTSSARTLASARFRGLETACEACHKVKHPTQYGPKCTSCHTQEAWPNKKMGFEHIFSLKIAGENLNGKHLTAQCRDCHNGERIPASAPPRRAQYDCLTCHQKEDPHEGALGTACYKCHGMDGWKGEDLRFDHDTMSTFALDQDHRRLACKKCHDNSRYKPLEAKCESCHSQIFLQKHH